MKDQDVLIRMTPSAFAILLEQAKREGYKKAIEALQSPKFPFYLTKKGVAKWLLLNIEELLK